jgi:hypothetical protein
MDLTPDDVIEQIRKQIAGAYPLPLESVTVNYGDKIPTPYVAVINWEESSAYQTAGIGFWDGKYEVHAFGKNRAESGQIMKAVMGALDGFKLSPGGMATLVERVGLVNDPDYLAHYALAVTYQRNNLGAA